MANVKSKNTGLEQAVFFMLRQEKMKFRRHVKALPGTPDIVFTEEKLAIFIDGDFWHGYKYWKWGHKLSPYWKDKIESNMARDRRNFGKLRHMGWHVKRYWGHQVRKTPEQVILGILFLKAALEPRKSPCGLRRSRISTQNLGVLPI